MLTIIVQALMWIGLPLGAIVFFVMKACGRETSGFEGLAEGLGIAFVCGIITVATIIVLFVWLL